MPRWHRVWALARKEIRDMSRDRRTIFMAIVFPLVLYPLLIIGLIQATVVEETRAGKARLVVAVAGRERAAGLVKKLSQDPRVRITSFDGKRLPAKAAVGVVIEEGFEKDLSSGATASVKVLYDGADQGSLDALDRIVAGIGSYDKDVLSERLSAEGLDESFVNPVKIDQVDTATPQKRGVFKLGKVLAFLLVTFCMMGALYPALDTISGEKERGTLETLLSIPASRMEILAGKYVAVFGMSVASVVANFVSLSVTMLLVNNMMRSVATNLSIDFRVPADAVLYIIPALLPLAAFFSAVSLGVAAFAKSAREGQYYLAPLYVAALPLTAMALAPSINLTYLTAIVPITSISLFLKDGLLGTLSFGPTVVAIVSTCLYAATALRWASSVFAREDVLFAEPASDEGVTARVAPTAPRALLAWVVTIILFYYAGVPLAAAWGPFSIKTSLMINACFIFAPALAVVAIERLKFRALFPLAPLGARSALSAGLFIPATIVIGVAANVVQRTVLKTDFQIGGGLPQSGASFWTLVADFALLPAVFEELFYRGFILGTFSARMPARWAIIASAALFAAAHLNIYEALPYFALGVVLALAMRATGNLLAPMVIHFANNLLFVYLSWYHPSLSFNWGRPASAAALVGNIVVGAALIWAGIRVARRGTARGQRDQ